MSEEFKKLAIEHFGGKKPFGMSPISWGEQIRALTALQIDAYNKGVEASGVVLDENASEFDEVLANEAKTPMEKTMLESSRSYTRELAETVRALKLPKE